MVNAIQLECKKDGLRQMQDGTWKLSLTVNGEDMDRAIGQLGKAAMGTRYMVALAEIGDDEQPVDRAEEKPKKPLTESQRCALLCQDERFQRWVAERYLSDRHAVRDTHRCQPGSEEEWCSATIKHVLSIVSRRDLDEPRSIGLRALWKSIQEEYESDTGLTAAQTR